jgi:heme/copper-type cytochrome/quinol oxidase subunit 2
MKKQIKNLLIISLTFFFLVSFYTDVSAQGGVTSPTGNTGSGVTNTTPSNSSIFTLQNPLKVDSIGGLVQAFLEIITYVVIIFAVLMFIWIGFKYVMNAASGNASEIKKLHSQLMWLVIGVAIIIAARVIVQVVINTISATGTVSPNVIQSANNALQGK